MFTSIAGFSKKGDMRYRIAIWACAGFFIAAFWALYAFAMPPGTISPVSPAVWALVRFSCPIVFASLYLHFGIQFYWVVLANAATYALLGLLLETLRQQPGHAN